MSEDPDFGETFGSNSMGQAAAEKMKQWIVRIERLEAEKAEIATDIREIYAEIKSFGFDTKIMRKVVASRKKDPNEVAEEEALFDLYLHALAAVDG